MILCFRIIRIGQGRTIIQVIICRNNHAEKKVNAVYALLKLNEHMSTELQLASKCCL